MIFKDGLSYTISNRFVIAKSTNGSFVIHNIHPAITENYRREFATDS